MSRKKQKTSEVARPVNVLLPGEVFRRLEEAASRDNRKKANLARILIEEGLDRREQLVGLAG